MDIHFEETLLYPVHGESGFTEITFKTEQISNLKYAYLSLKRSLIFSICIFSEVAYKNMNFWFCEVKVTSEWLHREAFGIGQSSSSN